MNDDMARLRPHHLATVWATAVGQLSNLAVATWKAVAEFGAAEADLPAGDRNEIILQQVPGPAPQLRTGDLHGETFGATLPGSVVTLTPRPSQTPGSASFVAHVDEQLSTDRIRGDIYRGQVLDEHGARVASLALDAGS